MIFFSLLNILKKKGAAKQNEESAEAMDEAAFIEPEALPIRRRPVMGVPSGVFQFFVKPTTKSTGNSLLKKGR